MHRRTFLGIAAGVCAPAIVRAQTLMGLRSGSAAPVAAATGFQGPGNVVTGATAFWGLRAYTAATIGNNCIKLRRDSDNATQDFVTVASGLVDVSSITTFKGAANLFVDTIYDQTGNGFNMIQTTNVDREPGLGLSVLGSNPAVQTLSSAPNADEMFSVANLNLAQPFTGSFVVNRTSVGGADIVMTNAAVNCFVQAQAANTWRMFAGAALGGIAVSDNATHSLNCVFNGASSDFNVDGSANTGDAGTNGFGTEAIWLFGHTLSFNWQGNFFEGGIWPTAFSGAQSTSMSTNQHNFWGF